MIPAAHFSSAKSICLEMLPVFEIVIYRKERSKESIVFYFNKRRHSSTHIWVKKIIHSPLHTPIITQSGLLGVNKNLSNSSITPFSSELLFGSRVVDLIANNLCHWVKLVALAEWTRGGKQYRRMKRIWRSGRRRRRGKWRKTTRGRIRRKKNSKVE